VDPTKTNVYLQAAYAIPSSTGITLPKNAPLGLFQVPAKQVGGGLPKFVWNPQAEVSAVSLSTSAGGYNGWSSFNLSVGSKQSPFWIPNAERQPSLSSLNPSLAITCGTRALTDFSLTSFPISSDGILTYKVIETSPNSAAQSDVDLSQCSVRLSFAGDGTLKAFAPTTQASPLSLYPSGIPEPSNAWFGQCTTPSGDLGISISATASGCSPGTLSGGGFAGSPAPGNFISVVTPGCVANSNVASDGVAITCSSTVDPSMIQFRWNFAGRVYLVSPSSNSVPTPA
jgi:hypothetical protein